MASGIIEVVIGKLVGAVVGKLGEMAVEQVANQASLLRHFRKDFEWLQKELTKVRGYLQHANDLYVKNESVKNWLADVQDIALDAEDMVEECAVQPLYGDSFIFRYKMGRRIRKLKHRMQSIMKDAADFNLVQQVCNVCQPLPCDGRGEEWKKSGLLERDARPVAIDAKVEQILHFLEDDAAQVIAVVGMGGIGKTFLLQNVYNHPKVRERFEKAIWLSISQVYSVGKLQYDIASHLDLLNMMAGGVTEQRAAELIHERLKDKSSLIVLDDVWRVEGVNNLIQRLGIPGPSKVVVTTRSIEVCNVMGASQIYHMELLSEQDSWNLFCLHAFPDNQQNRAFGDLEDLDDVAHQVEKECGRLPLAIKTVAASMASQKVLSAWESKLLQLKEVSGPEDPITPILGLSYEALPAQLKPCFLYFCFFGEDEEIDAEYRIFLWIGEGFIPQGKEQWSIGWSYLKQLNNLCLVEVSEDVGMRKTVQNPELKKTCKIHDLLLDLIISISKENKCAFTVDKASAVGCRHIFLAKKGLYDAGISELKCPKSLRTLSLSQNSIKTLPTESLSNVRALRVIDLSHTDISLLPICIGGLKLLRVLNLSNTRLNMVPECVRNLKSLWFLNVSECALPMWIGNLKCLQHLHVGSVDYSPEISREISKLLSLRTLRSNSPLSVVSSLHGFGLNLVLKDVAKLIHLQELQITIANEEEQRSLEEGVLAQLVNMRHLSIKSMGAANHSRFPEEMKAMRNLEYLWIIGFRWICEYRNLRVLILKWCDLSDCTALETMPSLMRLALVEFCRWKELPESFGKAGAFPQLRSLEIIEYHQLKKLPDLEHGAMPRLEVFAVNYSGKLQKIPEGFQHLRSLKRLQLYTQLTKKETQRLKEGGEYWSKIKANNPHVTITLNEGVVDT